MSSLKDSLPNLTQGVKTASDFNMSLAVVLNLIAGIRPDFFFGHSPATAAQTTDVWPRGDIQPTYLFPNDSGELLEIVSDNLADTQQIKVIGLDETGLDKVELVTLNGTTAVPLTGLWTAVNSAVNNDSTVFLGQVDIRGDGSTTTNIFAVLLAIDQKTAQGVYKVPSNKVGIVTALLASINKTGGATVTSTFTIIKRQPNKVFTTDFLVGLQREGVSLITSELSIPLVFAPSSEIKTRGEPSSGPTDISTIAGIVLIDKNLVPSDVLLALQ